MHDQALNLSRIVVVFLIVGGFGCGIGDRVEKTTENGVEVVVNHVEPYHLANRPDRLDLKRELSIDFGREDIGALGIANAIDFEVDVNGKLYFFDSNAKGDTIFAFDEQGRFKRSFGRKGQGPGEINWILFTQFDAAGHLLVTDHMNKKVLTYDDSGKCLQETKFPSGDRILNPLSNGNFLCLRRNQPAKSTMPEDVFSLLDGTFSEIGILDRRTPYDLNSLGFRGVVSQPMFQFVVAADSIFIANEDRGYEILRYDLTGKLVRKIRKVAIPVEISDAVKKDRMKKFEGMGVKVWFPDHWPPISTFFADDQGFLYVKTFETGQNVGESRFDVFDPEGVFFSQISLRVFTEGDRSAAVRFKNGKLYAFEEKPDGYRAFCIYRMTWVK